VPQPHAYEFDFDRRAHKTYQPSFIID